MKRAKRLTKRERKALSPRPVPAVPAGQHIHCIACGKHLEPSDFQPRAAAEPGRRPEPASATVLECQHRSKFPSCVACADIARRLLADHDRTGQPVQAAAAWH